MLRIIDMFTDGVELFSENIIKNYVEEDYEELTREILQPISGKEIDNRLYNENNFWGAFINDLLHVSEKLIIMSPFISLNRVSKLMDCFMVIANRNIDFTIITRPPTEQGFNLSEQAEEVINYLLNLGIKVIQRKKMHQKIAIIDNRLIWEGSLNILSHNDTHELMRRIEGENTAKEVIKYLAIDEKEAVGNVSNDNCPECGNPLVLKKGRFGTFLGCSRWPRCEFTKKISYERKNVNNKTGSINKINLGVLSEPIENMNDTSYDAENNYINDTDMRFGNYGRDFFERVRQILGSEFEPKYNKSGITFFGVKGRILKLVYSNTSLYVEFNVPVTPVRGLKILTEKEAYDKKMGTCRWIYKGDSITTVLNLIEESVRKYHLY